MKIHFIGIGGIGISALAQYMQFLGHEVSGSDIASNAMTQKLQKMGCKITIPHDASAIEDQDLVIHSAVIKPSNVEYIAAKQKNIPVLARREALKEILKDQKVFAVAGAHGKSTTSAILAAIMQESSAIIGAESKQFGSNVRFLSHDNTLVFEADESDGSFLNSNPYCSIVINAEMEHMEYYEYDTQRFFDTYKAFINKGECKVLNMQDPFLASLQGEVDAIWLDPSNDIKDISYHLIEDEPYTRFWLKDLGMFDVWGFGEHIALDASLAILAAKQHLDIELIRQRLVAFQGIKKRFDIVYKSSEMIIIDDYGHHPTEIKATLGSVKEYAKLKSIDHITAIWQPHKYSRTLDNLEAFVQCFDGVDALVILPVWSAGEEEREIDFSALFDCYNLTFADRITQEDGKVLLFKENQKIQELDKGLVVGFGAGDITYQIRGEK